MHSSLNDDSSTLLGIGSKKKIHKKAALVYKPHVTSRKKKVAACSPEFTVFSCVHSECVCKGEGACM